MLASNVVRRSSDNVSMATGEQSKNSRNGPSKPGSAFPASAVDETYEHIRAPKYYDFSRLVESSLRTGEPDGTSSRSITSAAESPIQRRNGSGQWPSQPSLPRDEPGKRMQEKGYCDSASSPISGDSFFDLPDDEEAISLALSSDSFMQQQDDKLDGKASDAGPSSLPRTSVQGEQREGWPTDSQETAPRKEEEQSTGIRGQAMESHVGGAAVPGLGAGSEDERAAQGIRKGNGLAPSNELPRDDEDAISPAATDLGVPKAALVIPAPAQTQRLHAEHVKREGTADSRAVKTRGHEQNERPATAAPRLERPKSGPISSLSRAVRGMSLKLEAGGSRPHSPEPILVEEAGPGPAGVARGGGRAWTASVGLLSNRPRSSPSPSRGGEGEGRRKGGSGLMGWKALPASPRNVGGELSAAARSNPGSPAFVWRRNEDRAPHAGSPGAETHRGQRTRSGPLLVAASVMSGPQLSAPVPYPPGSGLVSTLGQARKMSSPEQGSGWMSGSALKRGVPHHQPSATTAMPLATRAPLPEEMEAGEGVRGVPSTGLYLRPSRSAESRTSSVQEAPLTLSASTKSLGGQSEAKAPTNRPTGDPAEPRESFGTLLGPHRNALLQVMLDTQQEDGTEPGAQQGREDYLTSSTAAVGSTDGAADTTLEEAALPPTTSAGLDFQSQAPVATSNGDARDGNRFSEPAEPGAGDSEGEVDKADPSVPPGTAPEVPQPEEGRGDNGGIEQGHLATSPVPESDSKSACQAHTGDLARDSMSGQTMSSMHSHGAPSLLVLEPADEEDTSSQKNNRGPSSSPGASLDPAHSAAGQRQRRSNSPLRRLLMGDSSALHGAAAQSTTGLGQPPGQQALTTEAQQQQHLDLAGEKAVQGSLVSAPVVPRARMYSRRNSESREAQATGHPGAISSREPSDAVGSSKVDDATTQAPRLGRPCATAATAAAEALPAVQAGIRSQWPSLRNGGAEKASRPSSPSGTPSASRGERRGGGARSPRPSPAFASTVPKDTGLLGRGGGEQELQRPQTAPALHSRLQRQHGQQQLEDQAGQAPLEQDEARAEGTSAEAEVARGGAGLKHMRQAEGGAATEKASTLQTLRSAESAGEAPEGSDLWEAHTGVHTEAGSSTSGRLEFFDTSPATSRAASTIGTDNAGVAGPSTNGDHSASAGAGVSAYELAPASDPASTALDSALPSGESGNSKARPSTARKTGRRFLEFLALASMGGSRRGSPPTGSREGAQGGGNSGKPHARDPSPAAFQEPQATDTEDAGAADKQRELEAMLRSASARLIRPVEGRQARDEAGDAHAAEGEAEEVASGRSDSVAQADEAEVHEAARQSSDVNGAPAMNAGEETGPQERGEEETGRAGLPEHAGDESGQGQPPAAQSRPGPRLRSTPWGVPSLASAAPTATAGSEVPRPGTSTLLAQASVTSGLRAPRLAPSRPAAPSASTLPAGAGAVREGVPRAGPAEGGAPGKARGGNTPRGGASSLSRPTASSLARATASSAARAAATAGAPAHSVMGRPPRAHAPVPHTLNAAEAPVGRPRTAPPLSGAGARQAKGRLGGLNPGATSGVPGAPSNGTQGLSGGVSVAATARRALNGWSSGQPLPSSRSSSSSSRASSQRSTLSGSASSSRPTLAPSHPSRSGSNSNSSSRSTSGPLLFASSSRQSSQGRSSERRSSLGSAPAANLISEEAGGRRAYSGVTGPATATQRPGTAPPRGLSKQGSGPTISGRAQGIQQQQQQQQTRSRPMSGTACQPAGSGEPTAPDRQSAQEQHDSRSGPRPLVQSSGSLPTAASGSMHGFSNKDQSSGGAGMGREEAEGEQAALAPERSTSVDVGPSLRRPSTSHGRVEAGRRINGLGTSKSGPLSKPSSVRPPTNARLDPKPHPGAVASPGRAPERGGTQGLSQRLKELSAVPPHRQRPATGVPANAPARARGSPGPLQSSTFGRTARGLELEGRKGTVVGTGAGTGTGTGTGRTPKPSGASDSALEGGILGGAVEKADASAKSSQASGHAADRPRLAGSNAPQRAAVGKPAVHQRPPLRHRKEGAGTPGSRSVQGGSLSGQGSLAAPLAEEPAALGAGGSRGPAMLGRDTGAGLKKRHRDLALPGAAGKGKGQGAEQKGAGAGASQPRTRGKVGPIHALSHDILALPEHLLGGFLSARPSTASSASEPLEGGDAAGGGVEALGGGAGPGGDAEVENGASAGGDAEGAEDEDDVIPEAADTADPGWQAWGEGEEEKESEPESRDGDEELAGVRGGTREGADLSIVCASDPAGELAVGLAATGHQGSHVSRQPAQATPLPEATSVSMLYYTPLTSFPASSPSPSSPLPPQAPSSSKSPSSSEGVANSQQGGAASSVVSWAGGAAEAGGRPAAAGEGGGLGLVNTDASFAPKLSESLDTSGGGAKAAQIRYLESSRSNSSGIAVGSISSSSSSSNGGDGTASGRSSAGHSLAQPESLLPGLALLSASQPLTVHFASNNPFANTISFASNNPFANNPDSSSSNPFASNPFVSNPFVSNPFDAPALSAPSPLPPATLLTITGDGTEGGPLEQPEPEAVLPGPAEPPADPRAGPLPRAKPRARWGASAGAPPLIRASPPEMRARRGSAPGGPRQKSRLSRGVTASSPRSVPQVAGFRVKAASRRVTFAQVPTPASSRPRPQLHRPSQREAEGSSRRVPVRAPWSMPGQHVSERAPRESVLEAANEGLAFLSVTGSASGLTASQGLELYSAIRAAERRKFNEEVMRRKKQREEPEAERAREKERQQAWEVQCMRRYMIHKARPMPSFGNPFKPSRSKKPLTKPVPPALTSKRTSQL